MYSPSSSYKKKHPQVFLSLATDAKDVILNVCRNYPHTLWNSLFRKRLLTAAPDLSCGNFRTTFPHSHENTQSSDSSKASLALLHTNPNDLAGRRELPVCGATGAVLLPRGG